MTSKDIAKLDIYSMSREEHVSLILALSASLAILEQKVEALERAKNNNSKNSSLPPSTDQKPEEPVQADNQPEEQGKAGKSANKYNQRRKTGKRPGGQKGHVGKTLTKEQAQALLNDENVIHRVVHIGKDNGGHYVVRHVVDIKTLTVVTEVRIHSNEKGQFVVPPELRSSVTYGPGIKGLSVLLFGQHVVAIDRIGELISALTGGQLHPSPGTIYKFCQEFSAACELEIASIRQSLLLAAIIYTDATCVSKNGYRSYIRNFSTAQEVLYVPMPRKTLAELQKIDLLRLYMGVLAHDHETVLYRFGKLHAECLAHLLRYLIKNKEETGNDWSREMIFFLRCVLRWKRMRQRKKLTGFSTEDLVLISQRYDRIIAKGRSQNLTTEGEKARKEEKALLNRLEKYKENHLMFAWNFEVEFTNNMSERDLRKCKLRQKMSGGFRTDAGKMIYCRIMSVIETAKRKGVELLDHIKAIFQRGKIDLALIPA